MPEEIKKEKKFVGYNVESDVFIFRVDGQLVNITSEVIASFLEVEKFFREREINIFNILLNPKVKKPFVQPANPKPIDKKPVEKTIQNNKKGASKKKSKK